MTYTVQRFVFHFSLSIQGKVHVCCTYYFLKKIYGSFRQLMSIEIKFKRGFPYAADMQICKKPSQCPVKLHS